MILSLGFSGTQIKKKKKKKEMEVASIEAFAEGTEMKPNLK